jgi:hypothetical protein
MPKLEEVLRLLDLQQSEDDPLPETLRELRKNMKKSEDMWVLQRAIDNRASTPALTADKYTKPQLFLCRPQHLSGPHDCNDGPDRPLCHGLPALCTTPPTITLRLPPSYAMAYQH